MRRRKVAAILPLIVAALLAACAGTDREVGRQLAGYIGAPRATVEAKFGKPLTEETDASGSRKLTFYASRTVHVAGAYAQVAEQRPVDCSSEPRPSSCQRVKVKDAKDYYQSNETETHYVDGDYVPAHLDVWWCSVVFTLDRGGTVTAYDFTRYSRAQTIDCGTVPWRTP